MPSDRFRKPYRFDLEFVRVLPLWQLAISHLVSPYIRSFQLLAVREFEAQSWRTFVSEVSRSSS
jgi:hypothetical protein